MGFLSHPENNDKLFSQMEMNSCAAGREKGKESSSVPSAGERSINTFKK